MDAVGVDFGDVDLAFHWKCSKDFLDGGSNLAGGFFAFTEGKDGGAGAGDGKAEGACRESGTLGFVEVRDEFLSPGLCDDVVDGS